MKIIIDSTCQLEPERIKELGLTIVDMPILMNGEVYPQTWDMPNWREEKEKFIQLMRDKKNKITTIGASEAQFVEAFEKNKGEEMIVITQALRNTQATAEGLQAALKNHPEYDVKAFDSRSLVSGVGVQLLALLQEIEGKDVTRDECLAILEKNCKNTHVMGALYDLFYLHRGGRVGLAAAVMGTAIGIMPLLSAVPGSGEIKAMGKAKNYKQACARFMVNIKEQMAEKNSKKLTVAMSYVGGHDKECLYMKKLLETAAEELGWDLYFELNYSNFAHMPHLGPDYFEMGYVIGT
jgi:fatty acid kinase fatty acid binding subunit